MNLLNMGDLAERDPLYLLKSRKKLTEQDEKETSPYKNREFDHVEEPDKFKTPPSSGDSFIVDADENEEENYERR